MLIKLLVKSTSDTLYVHKCCECKKNLLFTTKNLCIEVVKPKANHAVNVQSIWYMCASSIENGQQK